MVLSNSYFPRIVKAVEEPLGLYVQPGRVDHKRYVNFCLKTGLQ